MTFVVAGCTHKIMKTSVVGCLPALKMHHVVIFEEENKKYAIDFGHKGRHWTTKLKLLLGQSVPGEVRVRCLQDDDEEEEDEWMRLTQGQDEDTSQQITLEILSGIRDARLRMVLHDAMRKNDEMNLYTNNCQHFSWNFIASL